MNEIIILTAKYLYILVVLASVIYIYCLPQKDRIQAIKVLVIAAIIVGILAFISGKLISDPRPFLVRGAPPLIPHSADNGFPSDHTLISAVVAFVVFLYRKKVGLVLIVLAIIVGISRILALVHHPLDIIGSMIIAIIGVVISALIWKKSIY